MPADPQELLTEKYLRRGWPAQPRPDLQPPEGWSHALLVSISRPRSASLSADGASIAFFWDREESSDLYRMPSTGGWPQRLTFDREPIAYWMDDPPQWSPDGRWLAFTQDDHVWIVPADGGQPKRISDFTTNAGTPRWLPDSNRLLVSVRRNGDARIMLTDREGSWPRLVSRGPGHDRGAKPSPDGRRAVYLHTPPDDLNCSELMLAELECGEVHRLAGMPGRRLGAPTWSPDGKLIAFVWERPGYQELFVFHPERGQECQLTQLRQEVSGLAWSADGTRILCTVNRGGALDLASVHVDTGEVRTLRQLEGIHSLPRPHPDGRSLVFSFESPVLPADIFRIDMQNGHTTQLTFSAPPALSRLPLIEPERVTYPSSDGLEIPALLYRPAQPNGAAVVQPHGGPTSQFMMEFWPLIQYFVAKGYTWLAPNYRGSTGYGVEFERLNHGTWGVGDTQDCLAGADYLAGLPGVQPGRIGIFGASYGAYLVYCALAHDPQHRFACGVAKYGDINIATSWAQTARSVREDQERMMSTPARMREAYRAGSPIWDVEHIRRPLLIVHGLEDRTVHPYQSEELVEALDRAAKTYEYKTYADEGHGIHLRANQLDFNRRLEIFLDWYLM
jgi:dipeptidyl aminopeptidase/acylaminoacyl peptidase